MTMGEGEKREYEKGGQRSRNENIKKKKKRGRGTEKGEKEGNNRCDEGEGKQGKQMKRLEDRPSGRENRHQNMK